MSSVENVVATRFTTSGSQAIISATRSMGTQTGKWYSSLVDTTRQSSQLNSTWRAMGTTIRYAIAGQAIFGLTRMVSQLKDVQQQLGLIQAIGTQPGPGGASIGFSTKQVNDLGNQLQKVAVNTITPINEINDATVNLLSTIQDVPRSEIPAILTSIGQAAKVSQTPIEDLTQAATTMNLAFGRANSSKNIAQFTRMWSALVSLAPGGIQAAPELATQLPSLSTLFRGGLSPHVPRQTAQAQEMSLVLGSLRFGAPPSTAMRGLQYLVQQIETPASKASRTALAGIGITPQTVRDKGIYSSVMTFLHHIAPDTKGMSVNSLKALQQIPDDQLEATNAIPGVSPSQMAFMRTALGRIHAVRAAITLAAQLQSDPGANIDSLQQDLNAMLGYQNNQIKDVHSMAQMWQKFSDRSKLQQASVALNTLSLQVAQVFEPVINLASSGIVSGVQGAQHHRKLTAGLAIGAATIGAGLVTRRALGGLIGGGAGAIQAAESLGGEVPTGTLMNPFYVRVIGGLLSPGGLGGLKKAGAGGAAAEAEQTASKGSRLGSFVRDLPLVGKTAALRLGAPAAAFIAGKGIYDFIKDPNGHSNAGRSLNMKGFEQAFGHPVRSVTETLQDIWGLRHASSSTGTGPYTYNQLTAIQQALGKQSNYATGLSFGQVTGTGANAQVTLNINLKYPDGKTETKRIHVPASLWANGSIPSSKGKPAARR